MSSGNIKRLRVTNNLPQFITSIEVKAARAVRSALILGATEAAALTPIDTGTLINSRFSNVTKEGTRIVGTTGYTADYAAPVHDPDNPQKFRRASAEKLFLEKGFERAKPAIDAAVARALKV